MRWLAVVVLLAPALAGCLGAGDGDSDGAARFDVAWAEKALPFGPGHDHEDRAHHRGLSTPNWQVVGYDPLISTYYGAPAGATFCGDAQDLADGRRIAAVESRSDVAFALADVSDPAAPRWLGELVMPTTHVYDLAVVPGAPYVVLATSDVRTEAVTPVPAGGTRGPDRPPDPGGWQLVGAPGKRAPEPATTPLWRTPCMAEPVPLQGAADDEEDPLPRPMSLVLVDISTPEAPTIVESQPLAGSGHSVFSRVLDGRTWVAVTTTRFSNAGDVPTPLPEPVSPNWVSATQFYELTDAPTGPHLELLSVHKRMPGEDTGALTGPRGHDLWMQVHPVTGQTLATLAGGDLVSILDLSDPRNPVVVGTWSDTGPDRAGFQAHLHGAFPLEETWDGRHYTIIGPEFAGHPTDHPSGIVWVLDTTDPTAPFEVGAWTLPTDAEWAGTYMFSNHYFMVHERTMIISMYHGGLWAVDLSPTGTDDFVLLPSIGVYLPDVDPPQPVAHAQRWAPTVEEALVFDDGTIVTFDGNSGLYVLRFDATDPAPAPAPWPVEPVHG